MFNGIGYRFDEDKILTNQITVLIHFNQSDHCVDTLTCICAWAVQEMLVQIAYTLSTAIAYLCVIEERIYV